MTRADLLKKMQELSEAIKQYEREGLMKKKAFTLQEEQEVKAFLQETNRLAVALKTLGPAGEVCRRCGGSGREP